MHVGILGRHPDMLARAVATAEELGHTAVGTSADADALAWVNGGVVAAVVIGGGVEAESRAVVVRACRERGVRPVEVFGPGTLRAALAELPRPSGG